MSFFDEDFIIHPSSVKFERSINSPLLGINWSSAHNIISDVIPSDYHSDVLDIPEISMNLEEMIEGVSDFMADYQQEEAGRSESHYGACSRAADDSCIPLSTLEYSNHASSAASSPYSTSGSSKKKTLDKNSDEYKRRRTLNNIAVKKSREKAKAESRQISQRLSVLAADNERLERRVESLTQEIKFLQGLFSSMDSVPEHIQHQVTKVFQRLRR